MRKLICLLFLFVFTGSAWGDVTYYVDTDCATPGDGTSSTCSGSTAPYSTLASAVTAKAGTLTQNITFRVAGSAADTSNPDFSTGYTMGAYWLKVACDEGKGDGCGLGVYSTSYYRLERSVDGDGVLQIDGTQIWIDRIQIRNSGGSGGDRTAIKIGATANATYEISNNIITSANTDGSQYSTGIKYKGNATQTLRAYNNIIHDFGGNGIETRYAHTLYAYNNTIVNTAGVGLYIRCEDATETIKLRDNIVQNATYGYWRDGTCETLVTAKNITSDGYSPDGASYQNKTVTFAGASDFHLASSDTVAKDAGDDLSADSDLAFSADIDGETRSGSWDIGADEYSSGGATTTTTTTTTTITTTTTTTTTTLADFLCGMDSDRDGSITKCDSLDGDNDGYIDVAGYSGAFYSGVDCDPEEKTIYPGVVTAKGCGAGYYRTCQADGTYTSCTNATLCEATGTGVCKYIQCDTGSDSNAGDYAHPYKTLGKISGGANGTPPASPYTLVAGDVVYILGGTCSTGFNASVGGYTVSVLAQLTTDGTATDHIKIKRYPGSTATLVNSSGMGFSVLGEYYDFDDIDIQTDANGGQLGSPVFVSDDSADHITVSRSYIHDSYVNGNNNGAGVKGYGVNYLVVDHSVIRNIKLDTGNIENVSGIKWLNDTGTGKGTGNASRFNDIFWDTKDVDNNGVCWRLKHGTLASDNGVLGYDIRGNTCYNSGNHAIYWQGSSLKFRYNRVYNAREVLFLSLNEQNIPMQDNLLEYNLFYNNLYSVRTSEFIYDGTEKITFRYNVSIDDAASYNPGDGEGFLSIDTYGTDAELATFNAGMLESDRNCYYNSVTSPNFSYFVSAANGAGGADYSLANWQSVKGYDIHSFSENPSLDSSGMATSANCKDKGWRVQANAIKPPKPGQGGFHKLSGGFQ